MHSNRESPNSELDSNSWPELIRRYVSRSANPGAALYESTVVGRSATTLLLDLEPHMHVLDLGCGSGLISQAIAPRVKHIAAVDFSAEQLELARQRFALFNAGDEVTVYVAHESAPLPLANRCIDCAMISGQFANKAVLPKWLNEVARVLKPDGHIFVTAENSWSHERVLPPGDSLPGRIGKAARRLLIPDDDEPAGVSYRELKRSLEAAGFRQFRWFGLIGTMSFLHQLTPLDSEPNWSPGRPHELQERIRRNRLLTPRYGVHAATSAPLHDSTLMRVVGEINARLSPGEGQKTIILRDLGISRKEKVLLTLHAGSNRLIARVPLDPSALQSDRQNASMLSTLTESGRYPDIIPKSLMQGTVNGFEYFVESMVPGAPLVNLIRRDGPASMLHEADQLLDQLNPALSPSSFRSLTGDLFDEWITAPLRRLGELLIDSDEQRRLSDYFRDRLFGVELPVGIQHGDYSASNILIHDGRISGLIDWESGTTQGLPIIDAINYVESLRRILTGERVGFTIPQLASGSFTSKAEERFLFDRYSKWNIDSRHHEALVYLKWLGHMDYLSNFWLRYSEAGANSMIKPVVESILKKN